MNPVKQQFKQVLLLHTHSIIEKRSKSFTNSEFMKECLMKTSELLCLDKQQLFKNISLSVNTVVERITEIASDLRMQSKEKTPNFELSSIAINESIDIMSYILIIIEALL